MTYRFGRRSLTRMDVLPGARHPLAVHPKLIVLAATALADPDCPCDMTVPMYGGVRTYKQQARLVKRGASKTMNSYHLSGHALDLIPYVYGRPQPADWAFFHPLARHIKATADRLGIKVLWGGDWRWADGAHWYLRR